MAAPVSRDGFFYDSDGLFVRPEGATYAHHRREASSLYALLTYDTLADPALKKKGEVSKQQPRAHKDEPGHFYVAQLALYGLKAYKTKDAAKKHLLAAFKDDRTLSVAPHVLQLERELHEEYEKATKGTSGAHRAETKEQERAQPDTIMGAVALDDDDVDNEVSLSGMAEVLRGLTSKELKLLVTRLTVATPSLVDDVKDEVEGILMERAPLPPRAKQASKTTSPHPPETDAILERFPRMGIRDDVVQAPKPAATGYRNRQTARKTTGGKAPKPTVRTNSKPAPSRVETRPAVRWDDLFSNGVYDIAAPYLAEEWPDYVPPGGFRLALRSSSRGTHLWGSFKFGVISGVFKTCVAPPSGIGHNKDFTTQFKWRAHQQGNGKMIFGENNNGTITFLKSGNRVEGMLNGSFLGNNQAKFTGTSKKNHLVPVRAVKDWKAEWRGINRDAFDAASEARWGGWSGDACREPPAASDTSGGGGDEDSDDFEDEDEEDAY